MPTRNASRVLFGYSQLTDSERTEFDNEAQRFRNSLPTARKDLRESFRGAVEKMDLGPVGTGCVCCGR